MIGRWVRVRLYICALVLTVAFLALAGKAWTLQIFDGPRLAQLGRDQHWRELVLPAPRGSVRDTHGLELAISVDVPSAFVNPREVADVARTAQVLSAALRADARELEEKLASTRHFEWLRRQMSPEEARLVRALALPGVGIVGEPRRFYPGRELAGSVIGFAGVDGRGLEGVELGLDKLLRGERASVQVIRDRHGELVIPTPEAPTSLAGADVTLTLDRFLQWTAERALAEGIRENRAKAGIVVILDPRTGAILAMASWPPLDPNHPAGAKDARNRPVTDAYEPGSVMKTFSIAAAVDAGAVTKNDIIDIEGGKLAIGKRVIKDTHKGESMITVAQVVKFSSNVGAVKIARKLGREKLHDALVAFGFGARAGIELPGEARGVVRDSARWGDAGLATISYGYGMTATPLQIAAALGAIASGGTRYKPYIVKRIVGPDGQVTETAPEGHRVLSATAARDMSDMLRGVLEKGGTGAMINVPGFIAAGKTGTAYKHDPVTRRYSSDKYLSSFIGFAPADDPRLVIVVQIDEPSAGKHYGGMVAGPVFADIASEGLKYLGVPPSERIEPAAPAVEMAEEVPDIDPEPEVVAEPEGDLVVIPDFVGMSLGQVVAAARERGVKVDLEGTGRATKQFPPPGRAVKSIACHVTFDPG